MQSNPERNPWSFCVKQRKYMKTEFQNVTLAYSVLEAQKIIVRRGGGVGGGGEHEYSQKQVVYRRVGEERGIYHTKNMDVRERGMGSDFMLSDLGY